MEVFNAMYWDESLRRGIESVTVSGPQDSVILGHNNDIGGSSIEDTQYAGKRL